MRYLILFIDNEDTIINIKTKDSYDRALAFANFMVTFNKGIRIKEIRIVETEKFNTFKLLDVLTDHNNKGERK